MVIAMNVCIAGAAEWTFVIVRGLSLGARQAHWQKPHDEVPKQTNMLVAMRVRAWVGRRGLMQMAGKWAAWSCAKSVNEGIHGCGASWQILILKSGWVRSRH